MSRPRSSAVFASLKILSRLLLYGVMLRPKTGSLCNPRLAIADDDSVPATVPVISYCLPARPVLRGCNVPCNKYSASRTAVRGNPSRSRIRITRSFHTLPSCITTPLFSQNIDKSLLKVTAHLYRHYLPKFILQRFESCFSNASRRRP